VYVLLVVVTLIRNDFCLCGKVAIFDDYYFSHEHNQCRTMVWYIRMLQSTK